MKNYVILVLLVLVATIVSVLFQIPILQQTLGFIYLTFVPGYIILRAMKIESNKVDSILLSVGLSMTFLMLAGLMMCIVFPLVGLADPLSPSALIIVISTLVFSVLFIGCKQDIMTSDSNLPMLDKMTVFHILFFAIPALGIVGIVFDNVPVLLVTMIMIAAFYAFGYSSKIAPTRYHLLIVLLVSISLVFQTTLMSKYINGEDMHIEAYVFRLTQIKGYWSSPGVGIDTAIARFESVLSVTILPTVYSSVLGSTIETVFRILFPLLFSLVPLVLYRIYETQTNRTVAFLSVLFFMANIGFFGVEPLTLARQMIAELLIALSIFLLFEKSISIERKRILLIIVGAGLIVSHYALAYLYVFLVILSFVVLRKWRTKDVLSATLVLLLFSMTFGWYVYVSNAPLLKVSDDLIRIRNNFFSDIYNPEARSSQVATLVSAPTTIVSVANRIVFLATNFLIAIGVIAVLVGRKQSDLDSKYRLISLAALTIMIACVVLPNVASSFNLTRFYGMTMIFLAPFFVLGGQTILRWVGRMTANIKIKTSRLHSWGDTKMMGLQLISILLAASFLFNIGLVEHVTGVYPQSWALDKDQKRLSNDIGIRISYYTEIPVEQDVVSTLWLSTHMVKLGTVYIGSLSGIWYSYGMLPPEQQVEIGAFTGTQKDSYAHFSYANTVGGLLNTTEMLPRLTSSNKIYTNGASEIYMTTG